ncbi:ion channel [Lithospermum erythrorhizon]|uniref:Ion channel n=1 Tax=Lithospermum erythrorhizon TaxID=34254 RepID=A0AAV3RIG9_LITER
MGTGWRRAFCATIPRDRETKVVIDNNRHQQQQQQPPVSQSCISQGPSPSPSPRSISKLGFFSNPTTPRMRQSQHQLNTKIASSNNTDALISPRLYCKTTTTLSTKSQRTKPSSPRSPFSILKNTLRLTKSYCGVCMQSVKTGQGMAIYTAECSHIFHFPCIASHVKKQGKLVCPLCNSTWKDVPLLANYRLQEQQDEEPQQVQEKEIIVDENATKQDSTPTTPRHHRPSLPNVRINHYGDDEPLLTPKCSTISEANEEFEGGDDEEIEEFKGFFVNQISSDRNGVAHGGRNVEVSLFPEAALISIGQTHETYAVVLKIKAPPPAPVARNSLDPAQRAPIDLVTVLDVSESMSGAKLQMLKRAMRLVISSLGSADRLSIVSF